MKLSDGQRKTLNLLDQWAQQEDASRTGAAKVRHSERLREIRQELENQATGGGRLAGVDMAADDNGQMLLLSLRGGGEEGRGASAAAPPLIWVGFGRARARGGRESGGRRWVLHRDTPPRSAHAWGGRSCTLGRWGSVQYSRC